MSSLVKGKLVSKKVTQKIYSTLEKGKLLKVNGLVIHQTGAATANHTFNSYEKGGHGAHFLIDKAGKIYQTASLDKQTYHVGKIRSKCHELSSCSKEELKQVSDILYKKGERYSTRVMNLHKHEKKKGYPNRFPMNSDSLGTEIVGAYSKSKKKYESISNEQNVSLKWLIEQLYSYYTLSKVDVFRHPEVSYKQASEGKSAVW